MLSNEICGWESQQWLGNLLCKNIDYHYYELAMHIYEVLLYFIN